MILSKEKSYNIQLVRGLAIIAVVFIHSAPNGLTQVFCRPFLNFGVGTFLFLSGMLSNADRWNPLKRIKKIVIPYCIWTLFYTILRSRDMPMRIPIMFLMYLLTGRAAAMLDYVFVYCELTLIIPLIDKLAKSKYRLLGFIISPLEIIIMRTIPVLTRTSHNQFVTAVMSISCIGWFSYFYLGYLLGNGYIHLNEKIPTHFLSLALVLSIGVQFAEGYLFLQMGDQNCGTQLKLSALLTGMIFVLIIFRWINSQVLSGKYRILYTIGNYSFGIFFAHFAIIRIFNRIPGYSQYAVFPINGIIALFISVLLVLCGRKVLGQWSKYLGFI